MKNPVIDKKMSKWVAKNIDSKPRHYFMNALMGMYLMPEPDKAIFCMGYHRNIQRKDNWVIEHAWIEYNGVIIDPTLIMNDELPLEGYNYFEVMRFTLEEITDSYEEHMMNDAEYHDDLGCEILCYMAYKKLEYDLAMKYIEALDYICLKP